MKKIFMITRYIVRNAQMRQHTSYVMIAIGVCMYSTRWMIIVVMIVTSRERLIDNRLHIAIQSCAAQRHHDVFLLSDDFPDLLPDALPDLLPESFPDDFPDLLPDPLPDAFPEPLPDALP